MTTLQNRLQAFNALLELLEPRHKDCPRGKCTCPHEQFDRAVRLALLTHP